MKAGLVTDGKTLYFGEILDGKVSLASVSVEGGPVRSIPTPFVEVVPIDISADGKKLLVLVGEGTQEQRALWIVPVEGGEPWQLGTIRCHAATWSPNGRRIAFAAQNTIYAATDKGTDIRLIQEFNSAPVNLRWSPDGKRLRFTLRDPKSLRSSFWELAFTGQDGALLSSLIPLHVDLDNTETPMTFDDQDRSFVTGGDPRQQNIYLIEKDQGFLNSHTALVPMNRRVHDPSFLTLDPKGGRLFAVGDSDAPHGADEGGRMDLFWLDRRTREFRPFLPGTSARDVDFSRDGRWITYVDRSDHTLWICRADGSSPRQIDVPGDVVELPRWSADGKRIALCVLVRNKPWRIFTVSPKGERPG